MFKNIIAKLSIMSSKNFSVKKKIISIDNKINELDNKINELNENIENCKRKKQKYETELENLDKDNDDEYRILLCIEYHCSYGMLTSELFEYVGKIPEILLTHDVVYSYREHNTIYDAESLVENRISNNKNEEDTKVVYDTINSDKFKKEIMKIRYRTTRISKLIDTYAKNKYYAGRIRFVIKLKYDIYYS